jgi:BRCA1-like protein
LERGASYVPLIIVIVLLIVAVVWAWVKTDEAEQLMKDKRALMTQLDEKTMRAGELGQYLTLKLFPEVGFPVQEGVSVDRDGKIIPSEYGSDFLAIENFVLAKIDELKNRYKRTFPKGVYTEDGNGGIVREDGDNVEVRYVNPSGLPSETTLEVLYAHMEGAMGRMLNDVSRHVALVQQEKQRFNAQKTEWENTVSQKDSTISEKDSAYETLRQSAAARDSELSDEIRTLEDQVREAEEKYEVEVKARREEVGGLKNELLAAEQDVRKAKKLKDMRELPIGPDGEILASTDAGGLVVLNRGKADHMLPGLIFDVFNYGKGAVKEAKGVIQVLEVGEATSTARIMEQRSPMRPIVQGDLFESSAYNPDEVMHFFLLGRFKKYGRSDAAKRLESLGAKVDSRVGIETHYLVLGEPENEDLNLRDTDAYKQAVELGVKVITEAQLSRFMNY